MPRYRTHTRVYLIQVAAREFDRVGYPNASLASVCREAGVTTGALYHYFDSKRELARAVLDGQLARVQNMTDEVRSSSDTSYERLAQFLAALNALIVEDVLVRAAARLAVDRSVAEASDVFAPWAEMANALVADCNQADEVQGVDPSLVGVFATSIVIGSWFASEATDPEARDVLVAQLSVALVRGAVRDDLREVAAEAARRAFAT